MLVMAGEKSLAQVPDIDCPHGRISSRGWQKRWISATVEPERLFYQ
jgi:hypothetical protein